MTAILPPLTTIPADIQCVEDYEAFARDRMSPQAWAYFSGGAADEVTLRDNREAFSRYRFHGRVLCDMERAHTRSQLFGATLEYPVLLAPVAFHRLAHQQGELATATAAAAMSAPMVVSSQASTSLEHIAAAAPATLWFQLYWQASREANLVLVRRAEAAGCKVLLVTVDAPVNGPRHREQRAGFVLPADIEAVNLKELPKAPVWHGKPGQSPVFGSGLLQVAPTWDDVQWLKSITHLPVVLKGVLNPADAQKAVDTGMDGIVVSNHGGRTLDGLPASIEALPAVAAVINRQIPILLDGGIRRGSDVVKALALGASAVLIGRPYIYGLAAAGAVGVAHVLNMLRAELEVTMALNGCACLNDIDESILWRAPERR